MASKPVSDPSLERYKRFVVSTMASRIPSILKIAGEGFDPRIVEQLSAIGRAVAANAPMVMDMRDWPFPGWEDMPRRVNGKRVNDAPFFDFEYWLYFRILTAVRFPEKRNDPFRAIKHKELDRHLAWVEEALGKTKSLSEALKLSLDANAHDLSQIAKPDKAYEFGRELLDMDAGKVRRLNIITDNFGGEFVADLVLAVVAAEAGIETVIHVKQLPIFVSDVTVDDVTILLDRLPPGTQLGQRMAAAVRVGMIRVATHEFWASPKFFDALPTGELGSGDGVLNVIKGDLNYRRATGDVSVPIETPFQSLAMRPPVALLSLRSIKSYCVAGAANWPAGVSRTEFPMEGSIVAVQQIPGPTSVVAPVVAETAPKESNLQRARRLFRRNG